MKCILSMLAFICCIAQAAAQSVGIGTAAPDSTAALEVSSTRKGFIMPRLSLGQRNSIINPARGLQVFNTTTNKLEYFNGTQWTALLDSANAGNAGGSVTLANRAAIWSLEIYTPPLGGRAFGFGSNNAWVSQHLPYVSSGYTGAKSTTQIVLHGMENYEPPFTGHAYAFTANNTWQHIVLARASNDYQSVASEHQVVLYGVEVYEAPLGGYAYGLSQSGQWFAQALPYTQNPYKAIACRNQIVVYSTYDDNRPSNAYVFSETGQWTVHELPYLLFGYEAIATDNQIILFPARSDTSNVGAKAHALGSNGVWVEQALPTYSQSYESISAGQ